MLGDREGTQEHGTWLGVSEKAYQGRNFQAQLQGGES